MIGAPSPLRDDLVALTKRTLINRCLQLHPETDDVLTLIDAPARLLTAGVTTALRDLARRWKTLDEEIKTSTSRSRRWSALQPRNWSSFTVSGSSWPGSSSSPPATTGLPRLRLTPGLTVSQAAVAVV